MVNERKAVLTLNCVISRSWYTAIANKILMVLYLATGANASWKPMPSTCWKPRAHKRALYQFFLTFLNGYILKNHLESIKKLFLGFFQFSIFLFT